MPRFKAKGMLEREPLADIWKNTLSRISTLCGRLVYLSSLRDPNCGAYRHHGLSQSFGREESGRALKESHRQVFAEWLRLPLAAKSSDLESFFETLEEDPQTVAASWLSVNHAQAITPEQATRAQRTHFLQEMGLLLEMIRNRSGGGGRARPAPAPPE